MDLQEMRQIGNRRDIQVWPVDKPAFQGDRATFRYNIANREVGSLLCDTEAECWRVLLSTN